MGYPRVKWPSSHAVYCIATTNGRRQHWTPLGTAMRCLPLTLHLRMSGIGAVIQGEWLRRERVSGSGGVDG
jgi:hypothetical protein